MYRVVIYRLALLLLVTLRPGLAFAVSQTFEGQRLLINSDTPVSIVLQMEELGGFLTGTIKTSLPLRGEGNIESGRNVAGNCNLAARISPSVTLSLAGNCSGALFEGSYTVYYTQTKKIGRGTFRLAKKVADSGKSESAPAAADIAASNAVACVKANTRCLAACPRGDSDMEYLCANHCRSKMNACKGKAKKLASAPESP